MSKYSTIKLGKKYSESFKVYVTQNGEVVSPFHDIPLYVSDGKEIVSVVNEIPRFENAKFEITKDEKFNPIKQDVKKEKPRFVRNVFPTKGYPWNYGALPQTWEDPNEVDKDVKAKGDNDPIDVIDVGRRRKDIGEVYQAKIIGRNSFALDGKYMDKEFTVNVVRRAHESWCGMINSKDNFGICRENTTLMSKSKAPILIPDFQSDEEVPAYVHEFEFIEK